ncbi:MAG: IS66 family insertion sequence element accessory protein TnpB [Verrucomicrobiota bacterium]
MTHLVEKQRILKVDSRGRVQTTPEQREALLDEYERSGLSGRRFAEMVGVVPVTFSAWVCQRKRNRANGRKSANQIEPVTLLEAVVESRCSAVVNVPESVVVELPGGAKIEVRSREQLRLVAELLVFFLSGQTSQRGDVKLYR